MICTEGRPTKGRVPVLTHPLDIPARLKEISGDFFVMFNTETQKYELHDKSLPYSTLSCVIPYDELDYRTIQYVREFWNRSVRELAEEIERYNAKLDASEQAAVIDKANYKCREALRYLNNTTKTDSIPEAVIAE